MNIDLSAEQLERFIVFEGMDGSGQDTQAKLFSEYLKKQGFKVWLTSEPSKDLASLGVTVRYILANEKDFPPASLQILMVADRAMHVEKIRKYLDDGYVVISIRYLYSNLAYGFADGIDINWLVSLNRTFPRPAAVAYLDLPVETALGRVETRSKVTGRPMDRFETLDHQTRVRQAFYDLAQLCPEIKKVDATGNPEEVTMRVREALGGILGIETKDQKPLDLFV
jgi:dTMP kinase